MTYADGREIVPAPQMDYLGHPGTGQEKGRGTLQTSALPLGYGAVARSNLARPLGFLNPGVFHGPRWSSGWGHVRLGWRTASDRDGRAAAAYRSNSACSVSASSLR